LRLAGEEGPFLGLMVESTCRAGLNLDKRATANRKPWFLSSQALAMKGKNPHYCQGSSFEQPFLDPEGKPMTSISFTPIGTIHSPFTDLTGMPIQPAGARETVGTVVVDPSYAAGLQDLEGFSHIYLLYCFHRAASLQLRVVPFLDNREHGVFATRAPSRPNPIGLSVVELLKVQGNRLTVRGIDVLDGTPLLDIKPYIEAFDRVEKSRSGWLTSSTEEIARQRSDRRFT
jgi:tRNA (adenine37-N6)-methyltransferase